jgi:hypothetical protein
MRNTRIARRTRRGAIALALAGCALAIGGHRHSSRLRYASSFRPSRGSPAASPVAALAYEPLLSHRPNCFEHARPSASRSAWPRFESGYLHFDRKPCSGRGFVVGPDPRHLSPWYSRR